MDKYTICTFIIYSQIYSAIFDFWREQKYLYEVSMYRKWYAKV